MAEEQSANQPAAKDGDIAVFAREAGDMTHFTVVDGPKDSPEKTRTDVYGMVGQIQLSAEDVLDVYKGKDVVVDDIPAQSQDRTYTASIAARGVVEREWDNGEKQGVNRQLRVGMAIHNCKRDTGEHYGYSVGVPRGEPDANGRRKHEFANFFKTTGPKGNPVELSAGDCLKLADGQKLEKGGLSIELQGFKQNDAGRLTAQVYGDIINKKQGNEKAPVQQEPAQDESEGIKV